MKLLLGTRLYVDFPCPDGSIYPRSVVEEALNNPRFRDALKSRMIVGGIFDGPHVAPKDNIITHYVSDIRIYNDEVVAELEIIESPEVYELIDTIKYKKAAIVVKIDVSDGLPGATIRKISDIECVHIKEDQNAKPYRGDTENQDGGGEERKSSPDA